VRESWTEHSSFSGLIRIFILIFELEIMTVSNLEV